MHPVRAIIHRYIPLYPEDWAKIEPCLEVREFPKGSLILEEGKVCRHLYFLESGLLRFFVWRDGKAASKFFTEAPYCFTSQRSYNQEIPAKESIETLEDSRIWQINRAEASDLLRLPGWSIFIRKLLQEVQFNTEQILEDLQNVTAGERYRRMLQEQASLLQRVPMKMMASYLGIAPQSLSRIRKKISQESQKLT